MQCLWEGWGYEKVYEVLGTLLQPGEFPFSQPSFAPSCHFDMQECQTEGMSPLGLVKLRHSLTWPVDWKARHKKECLAIQQLRKWNNLYE